MFLPHLKPGRDFDTVLENSLTLIRQGWSKGQAMAIALNVAGYRPPDSSTTRSATVH
jgi:hypothetical protein